MATTLRAELADYLKLSGSTLSMEQAAALAVRAWIAADRNAMAVDRTVLAADHNAMAVDRTVLAADYNAMAVDRSFLAADHNTMAVDCSFLAADRTSNNAGGSFIAADRALSKPGKPGKPGTSAADRGYRWKTIFLPEGSVLRMESGGAAHDACVVGDQIIFRGASVSPRGMTLAVAGEGRNAWRDLLIRFPGAHLWKRAGHCRADVARSEKKRAGAGPADPSGAFHASQPGRGSPSDVLAQAATAMADVLAATLALAEQAKTPVRPQMERRVAKHRRQADTFEDYCNAD
jgi:hypothetical protein